MHTSMNIKYKKTPINKKGVFLITSSVVTLLLIGAGTFYAIEHLKASSDEHITQNSSFSFKDSAAPNWWAADNFYNIDLSETDSNNTTVVGRNIAQGTPERPGTCFVMYAFKEGVVNINQALLDKQKSLISNNDKLSVEDYAPQSITMVTSEGSKTYVLHQYDIIGSPGTKISRGLALGYIQLKSGYVEVQGICEEANQLPDALIVYPAVSFEKL